MNKQQFDAICLENEYTVTTFGDYSKLKGVVFIFITWFDGGNGISFSCAGRDTGILENVTEDEFKLLLNIFERSVFLKP